MQKWSAYVKGDPKQQEVLEVALGWVASSQDASIDAYLAQHRTDTDIKQLKTYFTSVIDWVGGVFIGSPEKEMRGLEWGRLYEEYHATAYNPAALATDLETLIDDPSVTSRKGIYEYLLSGKTKPELLAVRLFDDKTKQATYARQTNAAKTEKTSNCPTCTAGDNANNIRVYKLNEMEADHVTPWSKGGERTSENCEMPCITHNCAKGNR